MRDFKLGDVVNTTDLSSSFVGIIIDENPLELLSLRCASGAIMNSRVISCTYGDTTKMLALGFIYSGVNMSPGTVGFLVDPAYVYKSVVEDILDDYDRKIICVPSVYQNAVPPPAPQPGGQIPIPPRPFIAQDATMTITDAGEPVPIQGVSFDEEPLTPQCHDDTTYDGDRAMDLVRSMSRGLF